MAKNLIQDGDVFDHTITSGESSVASGEVVVEGGLIGVAVTAGTYANSDVVAVNLKGVYLLDKTTSLVITKGDKVFYNTTTKKITKTITDKFIGYAWTSELTNATTVQVKLQPDTNGAVSQATVVAALTGTPTGTANGSVVDVAASAAATAGGSTPTATQVDAGIATAVATIVTGVNEQNKEFQTKINEILTVLKAAGLMATS